MSESLLRCFESLFSPLCIASDTRWKICSARETIESCFLVLGTSGERAAGALRGIGIQPLAFSDNNEKRWRTHA